MHAATAEDGEQIIDMEIFGNEERRTRDLLEVKFAFIGASTQQILGIEHADDVIEGTFVERKARIAGAEEDLGDFVEGRTNSDSFDFGAGHHDAADRAISETEDAVDELAFASLNGTAGDAFASHIDNIIGSDCCFFAFLLAEQAQNEVS